VGSGCVLTSLHALLQRQALSLKMQYGIIYGFRNALLWYLSNETQLHLSVLVTPVLCRAASDNLKEKISLPVNLAQTLL